MDFSLWLTFVAASTALLLIPGPTVLLVLSYALSQGRRVAVATALGVAAGDLIAMTAALAGLGALITASATAFTVLKWIGATYLLWLGWSMFRQANHTTSFPARGLPSTQEDMAPVTPSAVFRHAAVVTALNPKSIGFFVAFVPQFIRPDAPVLSQGAVIVATFVGLAALNALAYALLAERLRHHLASPAAIRWLTRSGGVALMGMGAATALLRRAT
ncbi:MAG: LysE family translocator [Pseudomonadota bacterium]